MKIALGTAQFGLNYGVTNPHGRVSLDMVGDILSMSANIGIRILDTAIAYGDSEKALGHFDLSSFDVVSKIPSLKQTRFAIAGYTQESLERLGIDKLYGLLMHDEMDVTQDNLNVLHELKRQGLVHKVGGSFYTPEKALSAIETGMIDLIQIPANQLDSRFEQVGVYSAAQKYGVEVHVRSLFLQGLLAVKQTVRPKQFREHPDLLNFDEHCEKLGLSPIELALDVILKHSSIAMGVVGCTNCDQLKEIVSAYQVIEKKSIGELPTLISNDELLLNPSKW